MDFVKSSFKNLTISVTSIEKVKELLKANKEAESEISSIVGASNTLSFDGMNTDFMGREIGILHIECFLVVKHYKNDRFESRVEYYVHSIRNEDNFELLNCDHSGYNISTSKENIDYTNNQLEEFKMNCANEGEIHLPFFSIYSR